MARTGMARGRLVAVGTVGRPHGIRGEVRVDPRGSLPLGLSRYSRVFAGRTDRGRASPNLRPLDVESQRTHGRLLLVKFCGVDDPEEAAALVNTTLFVDREELPPLEEGEYYHADLLGCRVVGESGEPLGFIADVFATGAHDVLVVDSGGDEWMLPVIEACVLAMDLEEGEVRVRVPDGLRD